MDGVNLLIWAWYTAGFAGFVIAERDEQSNFIIDFLFMGFGPLLLAVVWRDRLTDPKDYAMAKLVERLGVSGMLLGILWLGATYQIFVLDGAPLW